MKSGEGRTWGENGGGEEIGGKGRRGGDGVKMREGRRWGERGEGEEMG